MENNQKKAAFRVLTLITTPKLADKAAKVFLSNHIPIHYRFYAEGTASSEIMDMLGLGGVDKCVLLSMLPKELADSMLCKLKEELQMHAINSGVAFTVQLNGISNLVLRMLSELSKNSAVNSERKDQTVMTDKRHILIAAVVNRGFSGDVMEAAKSGGAKGGTVIHSHSDGNEEIAGFWGLGVQEEKEIVLILTDVENKISIMQTIGEQCGMHSDAKGIVMSMPVDSVIGI